MNNPFCITPEKAAKTIKCTLISNHDCKGILI